jgi:hypothetical protein
MKKHNSVPLIRENHPSDYNGYKFITLIQYNDNTLLCIVDNVQDNHIFAYVLDYCTSSKIDENKLIETANTWFETKKDYYPVSVEFSKNDLSVEYSQIYRTFSTEYVSRIIGPLFIYDMSTVYKVKRRKKKNIPSYIEFEDTTKN